jgi:DNA mismatch repair ATPase MutS
MARIKEILEIEQSRETAAEWRKIHLFQEGSFYRAYEVSAWLCHKHVSQFRVTHRHVKGIEQTIAFVGFPLMSLEKRTPEGAQVVSIAEKHVAIVFQLLNKRLSELSATPM